MCLLDIVPALLRGSVYFLHIADFAVVNDEYIVVLVGSLGRTVFWIQSSMYHSLIGINRLSLSFNSGRGSSHESSHESSHDEE